MADTNDAAVYTLQQIMEMDKRYRATFINSLGGFKSVCLIGTQNKQQQTNLAVFNSVVHIGANPPLIGFVMRPGEHHTLQNILETGVYTINHINPAIYQQAHQTSARYPQATSEFAAVGLTEEYLEDFGAPYVKESVVRIGVVFKERVPFSINNTSFIIGEVTRVHLLRNLVQPDGFVDLEAAGTVTCSGLDSYHVTEKLSRLPYAKAGAAE